MGLTIRHRVKIAALKPLPLLVLLSQADDHEARITATAVRETEIQRLPAGEIIGGYRRWLVLSEEGVVTATVVERADMVGLPRDVLGLHVLRNYLNEVGADGATRARLFRVWDRWRRSLKRKGPRVAGRGELDEQIQAILGVSRRTLLRHRAVQSLDPDVKGLLSDLNLPNWALERISRLRPRHRNVLLDELQGAADHRAVLARHFPDVSDRRHKRAANALAAFVHALKRGMADLEGREGQVPPLPADDAEVLRAARALINRLLGETYDGPEDRS